MTTLYRLLVAVTFPAGFRRRYGADMVRMFEGRVEQIREHGGSLLRLWIDALIDALTHGTAERLKALADGVSTVAEELRRWRWWMYALVQDFRYAARLLVRQPGVTIIAVLTLAIGVGGNTAIFSAVDAVLLRPLPYREPDRLVKLWEKRAREGVLDNVVAPADFLDWAKMNGVFENVAAYTTIAGTLTGAGDAVRLQAAAVSTPFFDILGTKAALGRTFRPEEGVVGQHRVVVLTDAVWKQRFGSVASVVGRKIVLNGVPHEVVGVLPADFEFADSAVELWAPLAFAGNQPRASHFLEVYARLKPGVTLERARSEMDRVAAILQQEYPDTNRYHGVHVMSLREDLTRRVRTGLLLLLGAVAFVLLIACVNVANLLLAKGAARRREMAVRAALGAGRARLAGQALTESILLAAVGGAAGLIVAQLGIMLLRMLAPAQLPILGLHHFGLDLRVLAFTFALSLVTGVVFGVLPAWQVASDNLNDSLKDGRSPGGVRRRLRAALVVGEIALASMLLVAAGLTLRSFQSLLKTEPGFEIANRLTAAVLLPALKYDTNEKRLAALTEIERRFASIPGVKHAGATNRLPLGVESGRSGVQIEGRSPVPDSPTRAHPRAVTVDFFRAMGMMLVSGRPFATSDEATSPPVAIVNQTMADRYWPGVSPIGRRVRLGGTEVWREVIGVVRDGRNWGLEDPVNPELYMPLAQFMWTAPVFVLATDGDPSALVASVRNELRAVDADLPLSNVGTMREVAAQSVASRRSTMILLAVFGVLALLLAAAGIYGVMAHLVAQRTSEIGVRMTLGARPSDVLRMILKEGVLQAVAGLALGLGGAVLLMRSFSSMLYQVKPADPLTLAAVAVLLITTALFACYVPARRATRVDPVRALRTI
jgi:putative ABC transport system permease protein